MKRFITLGICLAAVSCFGADVHGRVVLSRGGPGSLAVVFLEGSAKSKPLTKLVVDQRNMQFIPHVSVATEGTTVSFPNHDTVFHNVFADYDAKRFDLGMYPRGATKKETFNKPGLVVLMCSVHPEMSAYIMVVDTPYYAVADDKGRYTIADVPPGRYTMRVWHESGQSFERPVVVNGNDSVDAQTK